MEKYKDRPMDLADASLVVASEILGTNKIFTLDSDFSVYRINGRKHFEIIP
jgi:predicted nucleic acid-binding protein